jgi:hypothetical protein
VTKWSGKTVERAGERLARTMTELRVRAGALNAPPRLSVLANPGFENDGQEGEIAGWLRASGEGIDIDVESGEAFEGGKSLRLKNRNDTSAAWVRSEPFDPPATGRIAVLVRLKGNNSRRQPNLRLAVEGRLNGAVYYRYASVGAGRDSPPLKTEWAQYILPIDDLPSQGLTDVRVGFDLMGGGTAFIDDVQVYDLWFLEDERRELLKSIALADFQRDKGKIADCQRFIESYWPRFLQEHVEAPTRENSAAAAQVAATADGAKGESAADPDGAKPTESKRRAVLDSIQRMRKKLLRF